VATAAIGTNGGTLTGGFCTQVVQDVADAKADHEAPSAQWLTNAAVERYSRNVVRATNISLPLLSDDNRLAAKPAVFSNQVPRNLTKGTSSMVCSAAIFGVFEFLLIGVFGGGIDVVVDPYKLKLQGMVEIALSMYCDVANRQPTAFKKTLDVLTP
jgi:hypothetical protein